MASCSWRTTSKEKNIISTDIEGVIKSLNKEIGTVKNYPSANYELDTDIVHYWLLSVKT